MKWSDVTEGQELLVKGERWTVTSREGDAITMRHATLGEKTGSPPPDGEVALAPPVGERFPTPTERAPRHEVSERSARVIEKERRATARREAVARDNGVTVEAVEAMGVRLTLGGTLIGQLRPKETPEVSRVDVMDAQTMLNHLHFFHEVYPELPDGHRDPVGFLAEVHEEHEAQTPHEHTLPF